MRRLLNRLIRRRVRAIGASVGVRFRRKEGMIRSGDGYNSNEVTSPNGRKPTVMVLVVAVSARL